MRGAQVGLQASRALGGVARSPADASTVGSIMAPARAIQLPPLQPSSLPPLKPASLPSLRPLVPAGPVGPEDSKGKGPSNGRLRPPKASPHASSEEDVGTEREGGGAGPLLSPASPPFRPTRPLPPIGSVRLPTITGAPLPLAPVNLRPRPSLPTPETVGSMPPRRQSIDPFSTPSSSVTPARPFQRTPGLSLPPRPLLPPQAAARPVVVSPPRPTGDPIATPPDSK